MYYMIGIKGTGMSALAVILKQLGNSIAGCDEDKYYFTQDNLDKFEIKYESFDEVELDKNNYFIISSSYNMNNNLLVKKIIKNNYQYKYYNEFIATFESKINIAVSGTHGKTTTTNYLSQMLTKSNLACLIGDGTGFANKNYNTFLYEACEYKDHFLAYKPNILIINNIELDHSDYFRNIEHVITSFQQAANNSDLLIINNDYDNCNKIKHPRKITFGLSQNSDFLIKYKRYPHYIDLTIQNQTNNRKYLLKINLASIENIYNICASFICALIVEYRSYTHNKVYDFTKLNKPKRRFEEKIINDVNVIIDYAHHPTEINCLYNEIKINYPYSKTIVYFCPHTYTRTIDLVDDFIKVLSKFDKVYIDDVFVSREKLDHTKQKYIDDKFNMFKKFNPKLLNIKKTNELVIHIFLGAGDITKYII